MKTISLYVFLLFAPFFTYAAEAPQLAVPSPIKIGVNGFTPPFVMQGANHQFYGFDIAMMQYICPMLHRPCVFVTMPFSQLFPAVAAHKVDAIVSSITITADRATLVSFSTPYLVSQGSFLGKREVKTLPFRLKTLNELSIGMNKGTVFKNILASMGVKNKRTIEFNDIPSMIDGLQAGKVDLIMLDAPSANYWQAQSSDLLAVFGEPFTVGYGFGIGVNQNETQLLQDINQALAQYENSENFKRDYNTFVRTF